MQNSPISRRKATQEDVPFLLRLRNETMSPHLAASGMAISEDEHAGRVHFQFESAEMLLHHSEPIGLLKVMRDGMNWEILQFQLTPPYQGAGFGTQVLQLLLTEAQVANANLQLSVLKTNPARRLYERLGFVVVSENAHSFEMLRSTN